MLLELGEEAALEEPRERLFIRDKMDKYDIAMIGAHHKSDSGVVATEPAGLSTNRPARIRWTGVVDSVIFGFLLLFAMTLPHSIKGAERSWKIAFTLWLLKLFIDRTRPFRQSLVVPLLAYVSLSAVSTLLSPDPYLSWDRMKFVCLFLAGIVVAQNLKRISQVRWLVLVLVFSGFGAALHTGWQYTYGVGVRLVDLPASSPLARAGLQRGDLVTSVNGHSVHTPEQLQRVVAPLSPNTRVPVRYVPGLALQPTTTSATAGEFLQSGLGTPSLRLGRGRPFRAQGTLGHYVIFAEMLMQIGCMAWALLLGSERGKLALRVGIGLGFAGITAALFLTETRAALGGLVLGCLASLMMLSGRRTRILAIATLIVIVAGATLWIRHARRTEWINRNDSGTQFRVLMWKDGLRLVGQHPWFGVGMETVRVHFRDWNIHGFIQYNVRSHFHSTFLQIAVERGIPALLAWLWFCGAYLIFLLRLIARSSGREGFACSVAVGALAGFVAFTFTSFFHYNLGEESLAMIFFFYFGLAVAIDRLLPTPGTFDVA